MNEGCHGGWGYFDGLFIEHFGAVSADCAPYQASVSEGGCANWASCDRVATVENTGYIGGYYGANTEELMIKELRARGPFLFDFDAGPQFQSYLGGVLA